MYRSICSSVIGAFGFALLLSLIPFQESRAAVQVAGSLVVSLDARDASAGTATWVNAGSMGDFSQVGAPTVGTIGGQLGVQFNGTSGAYRSINPAPSAITGAGHRSIEVWAYNPSLEAAQGEEAVVAWGHRGTNLRNMSFNYGGDSGHGAVTHYGGDMGWGTVPPVGSWHHLVYTYDGTTARIYDNTIQRGATAFALNTFTGDVITLASENASDGSVLFNSEFGTHPPIGFSGYIALVRVHSDALTSAQILNNFNEDASRFGAVVPYSFLSDGTIAIDTPDFNLSLVRSSQTIAALNPKGAGSFDFTPADRLSARSANRYNHLGDLDLRLRVGTSGAWTSYATAFSRQTVTPLTTSTTVLAAADLTPTLPVGCPLNVKRSWELDGGKLVLRFVLTNQTAGIVQIGSLGIPMIFNNYITGRSLNQAHAICSFSDPYIGRDAGYLQVTRLNGAGPALLVTPEGQTPFEAYDPLTNISPIGDITGRSNTFEGFYEWMAHSQAYGENEWAATQPWNTPTLASLDPGTSRTYALKFMLSDTIRDIEPTLIANGRPVAVGVPGYVLPMDMDVRLFLNYPQDVQSMTIEPPGAITIQSDPATPNAWKAYTVRGQTWGRARMTVTYTDGLQQTIHYDVIKPEAQAVADLGNFLTTNQWYTDMSDPFHRAPSIISYDRDLNQPVLQDSRSWIAGLSDEAGAGSWLAAAMKEFGAPDAAELTKYEQFVDGVLWGGLQYSQPFYNSDINTTHSMYTVRRSMFFYQPAAVPGYVYTVGSGWTRGDAYDIWRSFNYPHVAAANWALYRLARNNPGLITNHPWNWYLDHAWHAGLAMATDPKSTYYAQFGQMEGSVFLEILKDLQREGMTSEALQFQNAMQSRANVWDSLNYPFGSEMPWDSTGQEEVYTWCKYFGFTDKAQVTINAITGYMPTVPHWGYNGSARRYWDFQYAGKISRVERMLHHYGSGINAVPVLSEYRDHPDDFYLLRIGYGGTMGALTNIDQAGFASCAFHAWPNTMKFDAYSGDYGPNFYGHAMNTATYIVNHPEFGWLALGGNVAVAGNTITVTPLDSFRKRVYVAQFGLWLTLDAGTFDSIQVDPGSHLVRVGLSASSTYTPEARLRVEQPATIAGVHTFQPLETLSSERAAYVVPLDVTTKWITLSDLLPLAPPTNPGATAIGQNGLTWTWDDNSNNEAGFHVYAGAGATAPGTVTTTTTVNAMQLPQTGLSVNTQYAFQVDAFDDTSVTLKTTNFTTYTAIEPVAGLLFSPITTNAISVASTNTPSHLASGLSGLYFANTTAATNGGWQSSNASWASTGLSPNTQYSFSGNSRNGAAVETGAVAGSAWTLANVPTAPGVVGPTSSSLGVSIGSGDGNPAGTEYAIYNQTTGQWVQAAGTLGASPVWRTAAAWGTVTVSGLNANTSYGFNVRARNGATVETSNGPTASNTTSAAAPPTPTPVPGLKAGVRGWMKYGG